MGDMVIVAYRPKPGREAELMALTRTHVSKLRSLGLATARPALAMRAKDGTVLEIFEWEAGAIEKAHADPEVQAMWVRYAEVCDYAPLRELPEASEMFARFDPIDV
jgi:hypothetical protein